MGEYTPWYTVRVKRLPVPAGIPEALPKTLIECYQHDLNRADDCRHALAQVSDPESFMRDVRSLVNLYGTGDPDELAAFEQLRKHLGGSQ